MYKRHIECFCLNAMETKMYRNVKAIGGVELTMKIEE